MDIPLPQTVAPIGPGGGLVTSAMGANALTTSQLANAAQALKNQYYPQATQADINYRNALTSAVPSEIQQRLAEAGLLGSESSQKQWQLQHPYSMVDPTIGLLMYAKGPQTTGQNAFNISGTNAQASPQISNYLSSPQAQQQMQQNGQVTIPQNVNAVSNMPGNSGGSSNSIANMPGSAQNQNSLNAYSPYGIDAPTMAQPTGNSMVDAKLASMFQSPIQAKRNDIWQQQVEDQYKQFQNAAEAANDGAMASTTMNQNLARYNDAMDRSTFTGSKLGEVPTSGWKAALPSLVHDFSPEQEADNAAKNIQQSMIPQLQSEMKNSRFTNADLDFLGKLKVDRTLNQDSRSQISDYFNGVNERMKQYNQFMAKASDPKTGVTLPQAQTLWSLMQDQLPIYDKGNNDVNHYSNNQWQSFLTPDAIQSVKNYGTYQLPANQIQKAPPKYSDEDIQHTAKLHNMTALQVKQKLGIA